MTLPPTVWETVRAFAQAFGVPRGAEAVVRAWTLRLCEQVAYTHGTAYGSKRAGAGRPLSKDSLAYRAPGEQWSWDLLTGAGTGHPTLASYPPAAHDITSQVFVPVTPQNHLATSPPPPTPPPAPPPAPPDPVTYDQFVQVEAREVAAAYLARHGHPPAASDLYHNAWRRLSHERWRHERILEDV